MVMPRCAHIECEMTMVVVAVVVAVLVVHVVMMAEFVAHVEHAMLITVWCVHVKCLQLELSRELSLIGMRTNASRRCHCQASLHDQWQVRVRFGMGRYQAPAASDVMTGSAPQHPLS